MMNIEVQEVLLHFENDTFLV